MNRHRITLSLILLGPALLLAGCFQTTVIPGPTVDAETAVSVEVDSVPYGFSATLNFGAVNPDEGPVALWADITNQTTGPLTVTDVVLDSGIFGIDAPGLPFSLPAGGAVTIGLTFDPDASGTAAAELLVTVDGADAPFLLNLTGEGNYPPVADVIVEVTGAGTSAINGTYVRTGETQNGYPVYRLSGTVYRIYGLFGNGLEWSIDDDFDTTSRLYLNMSGTPTAPNGKTTDWFTLDGVAPSPGSVGEFASSLGSVSSLPDGG